MPSFGRLARLATLETGQAAASVTPDTRFIVDGRTRITGAHDDGRTVMHLGAGRVWAINSLGSDVWQRVADGLTTREIVTDLAARYPVPPERIEQDVTSFLGRLIALSLIRPVER